MSLVEELRTEIAQLKEEQFMNSQECLATFNAKGRCWP